MRLGIEDVSVRYGRRMVLNGVSLTVSQGECVALMGVSGSGKSTLLSVVFGAVVPERGRVNAPMGPGEMQWILQSAPALARLSALENAALGPLSRGESKARAYARASVALHRLGLAELSHAPVSQLSGGERQRVAIARALASKPQVVLADEPTASLDEDSKQSVVSALRQTTTEGAAVIIATHDHEVARSCDRTLYLSAGKIQAGSW